ncbi:HNH endonuclease [Pseudomonas sp. SDO528_S397]
MISLADASSATVITHLERLVADDMMTAVEAWTCYSNPKKTHKFKKLSWRLSESEASSMERLITAVRMTLKKRINKRCAYCKRPMGQHGKSWNIEHIAGKTKFPEKIFSLENLTYACMDCNLVKNNTVDRKNPYVFDIIDPNSTNFKYGDHLKFFQLSTEHIHILKYEAISPSGQSTYTKLKLNMLEHLEVLNSLSASTRQLNDRIDELLYTLTQRQNNVEVAEFLHDIKLKLAHVQ